MKTRTIICALALCFAATAVVSAKTSPHMGTWKLNEAKSKFAPKATKNHTVAYEAAGDDTKVTVDGTDSDGNAVHNDWTGKFDTKFYAVTGDPASDERSYKVVNTRTLMLTERKDHKVIRTGTIVVSRDGMTRTVTTKALGRKAVANVAVYDKQP